MKISILVMLLVECFVVTLNAQSSCKAYFPFEEGTVLRYGTYDIKGKLEHTTTHKIANLEDKVGSLVANVDKKLFDHNGEIIFNGSYIAKCSNNELIVDLTSILASGITQSFSGMEVSIEGDPVIIPANLKPNQRLEDVSSTIAAGSGGNKFLSVKIRLRERKVEAIENIALKNGKTYTNCIRLSYIMEVDMMMKKRFRVVQWIHPTKGIIKAEHYDKKGELDTYMELLKMEKV